jgi:hypothetical protein
MHVAFFSSWGYWNLFFYPALDQWLSFVGGLLLVVANTFWLLQIAYWMRRERRMIQDGGYAGNPSTF